MVAFNRTLLIRNEMLVLWHVDGTKRIPVSDVMG